jgi:hypothetical protein
MKTSIFKVSVAAAVVLCSAALVAKEPQMGSGNAGGGRGNAQGNGPNQGRIDVGGAPVVRSNDVEKLRKENPPSGQGNANPQSNGRADGERQRTNGVGQDNWRYRQNGSQWWYWTADNRWMYWSNDRWVGASSGYNQGQIDSRYRWYDGRWWYWTTENRSLYWDNSQWVASSGS